MSGRSARGENIQTETKKVSVGSPELRTYSVGTAVLMEVRESTGETILALGSKNDVLGVLVDEHGPAHGERRIKREKNWSASMWSTPRVIHDDLERNGQTKVSFNRSHGLIAGWEVLEDVRGQKAQAAKQISARGSSCTSLRPS